MYLSPADNAEYLVDLQFYLLLVNKEDYFPRLTSSSPGLLASRHPDPVDSDESDLNLKVREHRRKMGFGPLAATSVASLLDHDKVEQQLQGVRAYLESIINDTQHHMRKNDLWKRMLYGNSPELVGHYAVLCSFK